PQNGPGPIASNSTILIPVRGPMKPLSVRSDFLLLDELRPFRVVGADECSELFRRAADDVRALRGDLLADLGAIEDGVYLRSQAGDGFGRRSRGHEQAVP